MTVLIVANTPDLLYLQHYSLLFRIIGVCIMLVGLLFCGGDLCITTIMGAILTFWLGRAHHLILERATNTVRKQSSCGSCCVSANFQSSLDDLIKCAPSLTGLGPPMLYFRSGAALTCFSSIAGVQGGSSEGAMVVQSVNAWLSNLRGMDVNQMPVPNQFNGGPGGMMASSPMPAAPMQQQYGQPSQQQAYGQPGQQQVYGQPGQPQAYGQPGSQPQYVPQGQQPPSYQNAPTTEMQKSDGQFM
jgi:hypothetical protein